MKKYIVSFTISLLIAAFLAMPTHAYLNPCEGAYGAGSYSGGCQQIQIALNKTVQNPQTGQFVDNLGINDPKYQPGQNVVFHLVVTNTGSVVLNNISVTDTLPDYVETPQGKTLNMSIDTLNPGASRTFEVAVKVKNADSLPQDQGIFCPVNQAMAKVNSETATDTSQFCIQKNVLGKQTKGGLPVYPAPNVTKTPPTGAETLALFALIPSSLAGLVLRRKSN